MMKKRLAVFAAVLIGTSGSVFAAVFSGAERLVEGFLSGCSYIKVAENKDNIVYISRSAVTRIEVDSGEMEVYAVQDEDEYKYSFSAKRYILRLDERNNLIAERR